MLGGEPMKAMVISVLRPSDAGTEEGLAENETLLVRDPDEQVAPAATTSPFARGVVTVGALPEHSVVLR